MDEDGDEDFLSSSEDEGVEVDIEDDEEEAENTKLLHQLAASLAQELKYSQKQSSSSSSREIHQARNSIRTVQDMNCLGHGCLQERGADRPKASIQKSGFDHEDLDFVDELDERDANFTKFTNFGSFRRECQKPHNQSFDSSNLDRRLWTQDPGAAQQAGGSFDSQAEDPSSWTAGWDGCATEALRYLVEDEGLPLHHPTVVAMKNHLDLQRERAYAQYIGYTETKSQDMSLVLD